MTVDLTGDTVIVTGAGRGLGRAYVLDLASRGANVVLNDVDEAEALAALLPNAQTSITATSPIPQLLETWVSMMPEGVTRASIPNERRRPELVAPLVTFLVSRQCAVSGEAFSSIAGHPRVFAGVGDGWMSPATAVTADRIEAHLEQIRDIRSHSVPNWLSDEWAGVAQQLLQRDEGTVAA